MINKPDIKETTMRAQGDYIKKITDELFEAKKVIREKDEEIKRLRDKLAIYEAMEVVNKKKPVTQVYGMPKNYFN